MDLLMFIMEKGHLQRYSPELTESFRGKCKCRFEVLVKYIHSDYGTFIFQRYVALPFD